MPYLSIVLRERPTRRFCLSQLKLSEKADIRGLSNLCYKNIATHIKNFILISMTATTINKCYWKQQQIHSCKSIKRQSYRLHWEL